MYRRRSLQHCLWSNNNKYYYSIDRKQKDSNNLSNGVKTEPNKKQHLLNNTSNDNHDSSNIYYEVYRIDELGNEFRVGNLWSNRKEAEQACHKWSLVGHKQSYFIRKIIL